MLFKSAVHQLWFDKPSLANLTLRTVYHMSFAVPGGSACLVWSGLNVPTEYQQNLRKTKGCSMLIRDGLRWFDKFSIKLLAFCNYLFILFLQIFILYKYIICLFVSTIEYKAKLINLHSCNLFRYDIRVYMMFEETLSISDSKPFSYKIFIYNLVSGIHGVKV